MTREEILAMEVGGDLDALVAEHISGLAIEKHYLGGHLCNIYVKGTKTNILEYSIDISAAWQVVEKMKTEDYRIGVKFCDALLDMCPNSEELIFWLSPEAICKAALLGKLGGKGVK